jgi:thymidylate synthase (FAD)
MQVITRPSVFLMFATEFAYGYEDFLNHVGAGDWESDSTAACDVAPEVSGRTCYNSFLKPRPGGNAGYIGHILEEAHGSVMEHPVLTVGICGVTRILTQEITRHRHLSPSQLSQRFVDEGESSFVLPAILDLADEEYSRRVSVDAQFVKGATPDDDRAIRIWVGACHRSLLEYQEMVNALDFKIQGSDESKTSRRKRVREAARGVILNDIESRLVLTGNVRAWRWFLERRGTPDCALEMRRLAAAVLRVVQPIAPACLSDMEIFQDADGRESIRSHYHKV